MLYACVYVGTHKSEVNSGLGSIYPNVVSRDQTLVTRPVKQVPVPSEPSCPKLSILVVKVCIYS